MSDDKIMVSLVVNGTLHEVAVTPRRTLLDALRDDLNLTGAKHGCDQGVCGACTVLAGGKPVLSCLALAADCEGVDITTVEGLARNGTLTPVQAAFVEAGAVQCGFCTAGMVLAATALLAAEPRPSAEAVREALSGNLCRCTGYVKIVEAVLAAARASGQLSP
jgi:carbon-monoxide dehydrogenase small subunit